jgi:hypothetical protein
MRWLNQSVGALTWLSRRESSGSPVGGRENLPQGQPARWARYPGLGSKRSVGSTDYSFPVDSRREEAWNTRKEVSRRMMGWLRSRNSTKMGRMKNMWMRLMTAGRSQSHCSPPDTYRSIPSWGTAWSLHCWSSRRASWEGMHGHEDSKGGG